MRFFFYHTRLHESCWYRVLYIYTNNKKKTLFFQQNNNFISLTKCISETHTKRYRLIKYWRVFWLQIQWTNIYIENNDLLIHVLDFNFLNKEKIEWNFIQNSEKVLDIFSFYSMLQDRYRGNSSINVPIKCCLLKCKENSTNK